MRKPDYAGIPAALSLATPKQRRKKKKSARRPAAAASFPVFYDKRGKRLRRLVLAICVLLLAFGAVAANIIPAALAAIHPSATNGDEKFPRHFLGDHDPDFIPVIGNVPVIGGAGALTRVVRIEHEHGTTGALPGPGPLPVVAVDEAGNPPDDVPQPVEPVNEWDEQWNETIAMGLMPQDPPSSSPMKLMDPITGEFLRYATEDEAIEIGDKPYATEYFGAVPDRTLILTFDDGPDAVYTPEILDVLASEGVPATFFVMGERVLKNPDILRRIIRDGHAVANHTWSHIDFDHESDSRNRQEINATERVIRATAGYDTRLFRMPYGDPDNNQLGQLVGQQLGQIHIGSDIDSHDWEYKPGQEVPVPPLDGHGHVVLMHDAGGESRAGTVAMLKKLIHQAKEQGYTFTTIEPLLPPQYVPQKNVPASLADRATLHVTQGVWIAPGKVLTGMYWFGGSTFVMTFIYLLLSVLNERRQRRKVWPDTPDDKLPFVSVILAAYNEEEVITRTLDVLRQSDYPASRFEVIAVNDGSTDATLAMLRDYEWDRLKVVNQPNSGKSSAINNGIRHADRRSTVIMTMDADTLFRAATIRRLARHFIPSPRHRAKRVGAVSGQVKVGNRNNVLTAGQSLEYLNGICVIRMAEMMMGSIGIIPGACSAWRRSALEEIGGFSEDTLAEDADAAMALQRLRYAVLHDNHALCDTEAPESLVPLLKQRKRWMFGNFQVLWKNRSMFFRPKYGMLGMFTMPYSIAQVFLNLLFLPVLVIVSGIKLAQGDWHSIATLAAVVLIMQTIIAVTAILIAREKVWHLLMVPIYRPVYEVMRIYVLYMSTYRIIKGAEFSWDKLERRNSVVAAEEKDQNEEPKTNGRVVVLSGASDDRLWDEFDQLRSAELVGGEPNRV